MTKREELRHQRVIEKIENVTLVDQIKELKNISFKQVADYLDKASKIKYGSATYRPVINKIMEYGSLTHIEVVKCLSHIYEYYDRFTNQKEAFEDAVRVLSDEKLSNLIMEINLKNIKIDRLKKLDELEEHQATMEQIQSQMDVKKLPKITESTLTTAVLRCVNDNDFYKDFKVADIYSLALAYLNNSSYDEIETEVFSIVNNAPVEDKNKELMRMQIFGALLNTNKLKYIAEEINCKIEAKKEILELNHLDIMKQIEKATRISELPGNLHVSDIYTYLYGNSTIYKKDNRFKTDSFKEIASLLLEGYLIDGQMVRLKLKEICNEYYPDKDDAHILLQLKFAALPKLKYLVEEVSFNHRREMEFIRNLKSEVNVYFIPNTKSPEDSGMFYNVYINRNEPLELDKILPLDIDIDKIAFYVQQNYDKTFKNAGGIILNRDECIGKAKIFIPNKGGVNISLEEKEKMDTINNIDEEIENRKAYIEELKSIQEELNEVLENYKNEVDKIYKSSMESINKIKSKVKKNK